MKVRIKFSKYGALRFIGHLDVMRYFQKAIRRAEIDICLFGGVQSPPDYVLCIALIRRPYEQRGIF